MAINYINICITDIKDNDDLLPFTDIFCENTQLTLYNS